MIMLLYMVESVADVNKEGFELIKREVNKKGFELIKMTELIRPLKGT